MRVAQIHRMILLPPTCWHLIPFHIPQRGTNGRSTLTSQPNFLGWIVYQIFYPWRSSGARFARESSAKNRNKQFNVHSFGSDCLVRGFCLYLWGLREVRLCVFYFYRSVLSKRTWYILGSKIRYFLFASEGGIMEGVANKLDDHTDNHNTKAVHVMKWSYMMKNWIRLWSPAARQSASQITFQISEKSQNLNVNRVAVSLHINDGTVKRTFCCFCGYYCCCRGRFCCCFSHAHLFCFFINHTKSDEYRPFPENQETNLS